jgi:GTPase SAR1 family protein
MISLVTAGPSGAGKSALLRRLMTPDQNPIPADQAQDDGRERAEFAGNFVYRALGGKVSLAQYDTNGSEEYSGLRRGTYPDMVRRRHVVLLCFNLASRGSFDSARTEFCDELDGHVERFRVVLVGCQSDRVDLGGDDNGGADGAARETSVSAQEAVSAAKELGFARYMEVSALSGRNCGFLIDEVARVATGKTRKKSPGILARLGLGKTADQPDDGSDGDRDEVERLENLEAHGIPLDDPCVFSLRKVAPLMVKAARKA